LRRRSRSTSADRVTLDGKVLTGPKTTVRLAAESLIAVAGVGAIGVRPSIKDARQLVDSRERADRGIAVLTRLAMAELLLSFSMMSWCSRTTIGSIGCSTS
jgi:hypothetical protein